MNLGNEFDIDEPRYREAFNDGHIFAQLVEGKARLIEGAAVIESAIVQGLFPGQVWKWAIPFHQADQRGYPGTAIPIEKQVLRVRETVQKQIEQIQATAAKLDDGGRRPLRARVSEGEVHAGWQ